jgi:hypothetical protein
MVAIRGIPCRPVIILPSEWWGNRDAEGIRRGGLGRLPKGGLNEMIAENTYPVIHLWSPPSWHEDQYIVGNREGLEELVKLLQKVLAEEKEVHQEEFFTCDGEGYSLVVIHNEDDVNMAVPYTESIASEKRKNAIFPYDVQRED